MEADTRGPAAEAGRPLLQWYAVACIERNGRIDVPFAIVCVSSIQRGVVVNSPVVKRSVILAGHKTSVSLEDAFWNALKEIARKRLMTLRDLTGTIDSQRQQRNLSSALRLLCWSFIAARFPSQKAERGFAR